MAEEEEDMRLAMAGRTVEATDPLTEAVILETSNLVIIHFDHPATKKILLQLLNCPQCGDFCWVELHFATRSKT